LLRTPWLFDASEVQQHYPRARVVCDLFHVIAKYGREVTDRVKAAFPGNP
jgi:transposase